MSATTKPMDVDPTPGPSISWESSSFPSEIYLLKQLESHCLEMDSLGSECEAKLPKQMSQRLPRFMRRRASSHNPKRIPKSIRQLVVNKINESNDSTKDQKKRKNKKNRKKYVNKSKHELSVKRREAKSERSVLHVWFAKRFKMINLWKRLIPLKNTTKNERNLYHNSKQDFVYYYLSFYDCIEIDYSMSSREQLIGFLSQFSHSDTGCSFGAKIYELGNREGITVLYNYNTYPYEPLVSVYFLWNQMSAKLWLWTHISVFDQLFQVFIGCSQNHYSNQFTFNRRTHQLERFRLIGAKALDLMSKRLKYDFNENLNSNELNDNSVHYFKCNENTISSIGLSQTKMFESIETSESVGKQKSFNCFEFSLIIKNKTFKNRLTFDVIVSSHSAKTLWRILTENRGHRTGGLHDFRSICLNTSSLLFPEFGFIDIKQNETKVEKLKTLLNTREESEQTFYVLRNQSILHKLSTNLNSLTLKSVLDSIQDKNNALVNVEVFCLNRGVPEEWDNICIPSDRDIESIFNKTFNENIDEKTNELKRKTIGLIEFGKYSLETSKGKGLGIITINGLKEIIEINERIINLNKNYKNNKLFATFKSIKSSMYRMIDIKVIDFVVSA